MRIFRYFSPLIVYVGAWHSFNVTGWQIWMPVVYSFVLIPLLELIIKPDPANMNTTEEELAKKTRLTIFYYM
jgi:alkane 1-monooxygenase